MASVESSYALCNSEFATASSKKKQKLLYGSSCSAELSILTSILSKKSVSLSEVPTLSSKNAFLCIACQKHLIKCKQLEEELFDMIFKINSKIDMIHSTRESWYSAIFHVELLCIR